MIVHQLQEMNPITCQWVNVTMTDENDGSFIDDLMVLYNEEFNSYKGEGKIVDPVLHIKYADAEGAQVSYSVERFDDGNVMILHDMRRKSCSALVSRDPNLEMIPLEASAAYEELAAAVGGYVDYIHNDHCF